MPWVHIVKEGEKQGVPNSPGQIYSVNIASLDTAWCFTTMCPLVDISLHERRDHVWLCSPFSSQH